ncbi:MAG: DUF4468 domain-containing protein [Sphingobacteriales bacterium JAD_PAG50586_3]|nr:MAG: DUF4468 domain-containing protein [Sphingobacteriales bacterium JAD_PAG50586_3]
MRTFLLFSILLITSALSAQTVNVPPRKNKMAVYEGIMRVDSTFKKDVLYERARGFFNSWFPSAIPIIQYANKDSGQIIINPAISLQFKRLGIEYSGGLWYYMGTFDFKDGKYRYKLENFTNTGFMAGSRSAQDLGPIECLYEDATCWPGVNMGSRPLMPERKVILTDVHKEIVKFMAAFDAEMRKPLKDDW